MVIRRKRRSIILRFGDSVNALFQSGYIVTQRINLLHKAVDMVDFATSGRSSVQYSAKAS